MTAEPPRVGEDDRSAQLKLRIQRHLDTALAGMAGAGWVAVLLYALADRLVSTERLRDVLQASVMLAGLLAALAVMLVSALRHFRCPACERRVWLQVAWHREAFGILAAKHCRGCGVRLFPDRRSPMQQVALVALLVGIASAVAVALWR